MNVSRNIAKSSGVYLFACWLVLICFVSPTFGAVHCVRAGASGDGSDWANAYGSLPTVLVRGDTYYVADGQYSGVTLNDAASGSQKITIVKATAQSHGTEVGWLAQYGDGVARFGNLNITQSHYIFDGASGGGPGSWRSGHGFELLGSGNIVNLSGNAHYIDIRHTQIHGPDLDTYARGINGTTSSPTNISVSHCWIHTVFGVHFYMLNWDNILVEYSMIEKNKSTAAWHSESIVATGADRVVLRFNYWKSVQGTAVVAGINSGYESKDWEIYGNVIHQSTHFIYMYNEPNHTNHTWADGWKIYNNTICGPWWKGSINGDLRNTQVYNNLWYDFQEPSNYMTPPVGTRLNNSYHDVDFRGGIPSSSGELLLTGDPFIGHAAEDFRLTQATAAGVSLPVAYNTDMFGNIRGSDGNWDRGAIEYSDAPSLFAIAGPDIEALDADANGVEFLTIDGSASYSTDGTIIAYLWWDGQQQIGTSAILRMPFTTGLHSIVLEVVDDKGSRATDSVEVSVLAPMPGDCNGDGTVNLDDFIILKQNYGSNSATWTQGDFTGDGSVDLDDFIILKQNYGL